MPANSEKRPLLQTVEAIRRGNNERHKEVSEETEEKIGKHTLTLMAIESAVNGAS